MQHYDMTVYHGCDIYIIQYMIIIMSNSSTVWFTQNITLSQ
jgi:hypothetical protein